MVRRNVHIAVPPRSVAWSGVMNIDVSRTLDVRDVRPGPGRADVVAAMGGEELHDTCHSTVTLAVLAVSGMNCGRGQSEPPPLGHALQSTDNQ